MPTSVTQYPSLPARLALSCYQGATFRHRLTYKAGSPAVAVDLTGYSASLVMDDGTTLTDTNGGITLGGSTGTIDLYLSAVATAARTPGSVDYTLSLTPPGTSGDVIILLDGQFGTRDND